MLYYRVCFEASSLVISGQPFCLFLPLCKTSLHLSSVLFTFECVVLFSCTVHFNYRLAFILFFTIKNSHEKGLFCFEQLTLSPHRRHISLLH